MKKLLIIGSTVVDVIIQLDHLPVTSEDTNINSQKLSLGGCAFNVSDTVRHFNIPYLLFSPVGTGVYGDYIKKEFQKKSLPLPPFLPETPNGCCYCFVEHTGERTFVCEHGAEYQFRPEWFSSLHIEEFDSAYVCGIELEEKSGGQILNFLENAHFNTLLFAPGPRINSIAKEKLDRMFKLSPILHLNDDEALRFSGTVKIEESAIFLAERTHNSVVITLGKEGVYLYENGVGQYISTTSVTPVDTIGAGDSHAGALLSCLKSGHTLRESCLLANQVSQAVVLQSGALLSDDAFRQLNLM